MFNIPYEQGQIQRVFDFFLNASAQLCDITLIGNIYDLINKLYNLIFFPPGISLMIAFVKVWNEES